MDELSQKLAAILNDPESMNRVREMAEDILGEKNEPEPKNEISDFFNDSDLANVMKLVTKLNSSGEDTRSGLLTALKPHLSEPKREKVDTAIKFLRLLELLPILKESGVLGKLL
jgi:hypothetical protein